MKTETKQIHIMGTPSVEIENIIDCIMVGQSRIKLTVELAKVPRFDLDTLKIFADFEVPSKIKEFCEEKNLTKDELVDWLNKNYE